MNRYILKIVMIVSFTLSLNANFLQTNKLGTGIKIGNLGFGFDIYKEIYEKTNLRLNINYFSIARSQQLKSVTYKLDLNLFTTGLLVDYFIFDGSFRSTFGLYYNGNKLSGNANIGDKEIEIGDKKYGINDIGSLGLTIEFQKVNPYFGIGWGNSSKIEGLSFAFDMGLLYQGAPNVTFNPDIKNEELKDEININVKKEIIKVEDVLKLFKLYPIISLGLNYRF